MNTINTLEDLQPSLDQVIDFLESKRQYIFDDLRKRLIALVNLHHQPDSSDNFNVGNSGDMLFEIKEQMEMVRTLRQKVLENKGESQIRELKDLISSTTSLFAMYTKYSADIVNQDRMKKIEMAVVESVKMLEPNIQDKYYEYLEELLSE
jgi:hypothetical protein